MRSLRIDIESSGFKLRWYLILIAITNNFFNDLRYSTCFDAHDSRRQGFRFCFTRGRGLEGKG